MSEPYTLPSRVCCWAGNVAFPYPCPWHPSGQAEHRDWRPVGVTIEGIDPTPRFPTLLVPGRDEPIDKYTAENERMIADWRRRVHGRRAPSTPACDEPAGGR